MSDNLRSKLIRLAYAKPEMRTHLLPLLVTANSLNVSQQKAILSKFKGGLLKDVLDGVQSVFSAAFFGKDEKLIHTMVQEGYLAPYAKGAYNPKSKINSTDKFSWTPKGLEYLRGLQDGPQKTPAALDRAKKIQGQFFQNRYHDLEKVKQKGFQFQPPLATAAVDGFDYPASPKYTISKNGQNLLEVRFLENPRQTTFTLLAGRWASKDRVEWGDLKGLLAALSDAETSA